ncbi:hypothetical protein [Cerasicoccus frondis]|uniref:hypothetical protein n=1 Tax=Cerasicoccus frondis TaxID=490090 RepID=UPI002852CA7A|nr:hypothetical protein [Cerasicoccus frondis]
MLKARVLFRTSGVGFSLTGFQPATLKPPLRESLTVNERRKARNAGAAISTVSVAWLLSGIVGRWVSG